MPFVLLYLRKRGRSDPLYAQHIKERFGSYSSTLPGAVWVHAISLGEMRSATPLIRALLAQGESIVTTHFTPAGRREAQREFKAEISAGRVQVIWVPFEYDFAYRRFLRKFKPKYGLVMEIEIWPRMIMTCRAEGTPLFMCNAQYPQKSYDRDIKGLGIRAALVAGFAGGFVKSKAQHERFSSVGLQNIHITGELRFDQPIPQAHIKAAEIAKPALTQGRIAFTLTSVVEGEDEVYINMIKQTSGVFFIYVPRAPERFDEVAQLLQDAGLNFARRSTLLTVDLSLTETTGIDVLLGDSMGEMYFYLGLCDRAIVGGGFNPHGAHNVIEPLALQKPVIVGPHIWTIEYPAIEAIEAGVCHHVKTEEALLQAVNEPVTVSTEMITDFYHDHAGGVQKTLSAISAQIDASDQITAG